MVLQLPKQSISLLLLVFFSLRPLIFVFILIIRLTLFFFVFSKLEITEIAHQNELKCKEEIEEASEIDDEILSSEGEDSRVNHILCVVIVDERGGKVVGDEAQLIIAVAFEGIEEVEIVGRASDSRKAIDLNHANK